MRALLMLLAIVAMAAIPAAAVAAQAAPAAKQGVAKPAKPAKAPASTAVVNINTATQAQLESLPGVGAKAAERILEYRQKNGLFKKVEETIEIVRSCPGLLIVPALDRRYHVSRRRQKSQQISR